MKSLLMCAALLAGPVHATSVTSAPTSAPTAVCTTVAGWDEPDGSDCIFPFTYGGVTYNQCASVLDNPPYITSNIKLPSYTSDGDSFSSSGGTLWCSTITQYSSSNTNKRKRWGFCNCDLRPDCDADGGYETADQDKKCVFPFTYRSQRYNRCVATADVTPPSSDGAAAPEDGGDPDYWCSTASGGVLGKTGTAWAFCNCGDYNNFPTQAPTPPVTEQPTESPTSPPTSCEVVATNADGVSCNSCNSQVGVKCTFPFDFQNTNGVVKATFDYCPTISELKSLGNSIEGPKGQGTLPDDTRICRTDNDFIKDNTYGWGICECNNADYPTPAPTGQPSTEPTPAPSRSPTTAQPSSSPTTEAPTKEPTEPPTKSPTTAKPTSAPSNAPTRDFGCSTDGGKFGSVVPCVFPFTFNNKVYNYCANAAGEASANLPYKYNDAATTQPAKDTTDTNFWCATTAEYSKTSTQIVNGKGTRLNWGYCDCNDGYGFPTFAPSKAPTTGMPSKAPTLAPTGTPTISCDIVPSPPDNQLIEQSGACVFPFTYRNSKNNVVRTFDHCPTIGEARAINNGGLQGAGGMDDSTRWCSIASTYSRKNRPLEWGVCDPTCVHPTETPTTTPTNFPTVYHPTCTASGAYLTGSTDCSFPFTLNGITYNRCIDENNVPPYTTTNQNMTSPVGDNLKPGFWCATVPNYALAGSEKKQWGYCSCDVFPTDAPTPPVPTQSPTTHSPTEATETPTEAPSQFPTTEAPTEPPTSGAPTMLPTTGAPISEAPSLTPTAPTGAPSAAPSNAPTESPTPTVPVTGAPTLSPSDTPTALPTALPSDAPTPLPSDTTTQSPSSTPTVVPTALEPITMETTFPGLTAADFDETAFKEAAAAMFGVNPSDITVISHGAVRRRLNTGGYRVEYEVAVTANAAREALLQKVSDAMTYSQGAFSGDGDSSVIDSGASTSSPTSSSDDSSNTGLIVGVVVGVVVGVPLLVFGVFSIMYKTSPDSLPDGASKKLAFLGAPGPSRHRSHSASQKEANKAFEMTESETPTLANKPTEVERGMSEREIISPKV